MTFCSSMVLLLLREGYFFLVERCKRTHCNQETTWPRIYCSEISEILLLNISDVPISLFKESFLLLFELKIHCKFYVLY